MNMNFQMGAVPGVKYGLVTKTKPAAQQKKRVLKSAFGKDALEDSDDGDDGEGGGKSEIARVNSHLQKKAKESQSLLQSAISENPSLYDYDGSYDTFKAAETKSHHLSGGAAHQSAQPKARYVESLLAASKVREKEKERIFEKILLKEQKEEEAEYGEQPKFMTTAYKNKLIEDKKWELENKKAEELDRKTDVRSSGMHGFYSNLLTKNISMGGDVGANAISVYTAGSERQERLVNDGVSSTAPSNKVGIAVEKEENRGSSRSGSSSSGGGGGSSSSSSLSVNTVEGSRSQQQAADHIGSTGSAPSGLKEKPEASEAIEVPTASASASASALSKEEQLALAKQRFLERKKNKASS